MRLPIDGYYLTIRNKSMNNTFGYVRTDSEGNPKPHQGWDIAAIWGSPVYAIADGKIEFIANSGDYGKQICLSFTYKNQTLYAFYAHLNSINVQSNIEVKEGTKLGTVGQTGNANGQHHSQTHLHLEIRTVKDQHPGAGLQNRRDPVTVLGAQPLVDIIFSDFPKLVK